MPAHPPFVAAFASSLVVTLGTLLMRRVGYLELDDIGVLPDTGFRLLPDWKDYTYLDDIYAALYAVAFFVWILTLETRRRNVIVRRSFVLFAFMQVVAGVSFISTPLPDPRRKCGDWHCEVFQFSMHIIWYVLAGCTIATYCETVAVSVLSWVVTVLGSLLSIAVHDYYTVDVFCSYYISVLIYVTYMWYVRAPQSIRHRRLLAWFESDHLEMCDENELGNSSIITSMSVAPEENKHHIEQLLNRVDTITDKDQLRQSLISLVVTVVLSGSAAIVMMAVNNYANEERPITRHLPDPIMDALPELPQRTADAIVYSLLGVVVVGMAMSDLRFPIMRRNVMLFGSLLVMRWLTVVATFPPDPSPSCSKREHSPGVTCGDLIFSGHTVLFLLCTFTIQRYFRRWWATVLAYCYTTVGLFVIIMSRLHYTRDVLVAIVVTACLYNLHMTIWVDRADRVSRYPVLWWMERDYYFAIARRRARLLDRSKTNGGDGTEHDAQASPSYSSMPDDNPNNNNNNSTSALDRV